MPTQSQQSHPIQRALITGASRGLGLALARSLRERGAVVVGLARDLGALERALQPIGALPLAADIGSTDAEAIATRAQHLAGGPIDLFVHAASTLGPLDDDPEDPMPRLSDLSAEALARVFEVNTLGPARLVRALHRSMRPVGGTVLVVSSDAAVEAYPGWGPYGASKTALDHLVRTWAAEDAVLRFLSVDPGEMDTAMHAAAMPSANPSALARPSEVARRILTWLADAESGTRASLPEAA